MSRLRRVRRWGPGLLLLSPSIVLIAVFVYGLIGWNVKVSLSNWRQAQPTSGFAGLQAYRDLNKDPVWWSYDVKHLVIFTVVFIVGTLLVGWTLAFPPANGVKGA